MAQVDAVGSSRSPPRGQSAHRLLGSSACSRGARVFQAMRVAADSEPRGSGRLNGLRSQSPSAIGKLTRRAVGSRKVETLNHSRRRRHGHDRNRWPRCAQSLRTRASHTLAHETTEYEKLSSATSRISKAVCAAEHRRSDHLTAARSDHLTAADRETARPI